jgi:hypothetical protein
MGPYVMAIPYTNDSAHTGPFIWAQQGQNDAFVEPANAPGGRVGAIVGQFLMVGDILQQQTQIIATGNGTLSNFTFGLSGLPMLANGTIYDQAGLLSGQFVNGSIQGTGLLGAPSLPGSLTGLYDVYVGGIYAYSVFSLAIATDPTQNLFISLTANGVTQNAPSAVYAYANGIATWTWNGTPFGFGSAVTYPVTFAPASLSTTIVSGSVINSSSDFSGGNLTQFGDYFHASTYNSTLLSIAFASDPTQSAFTSVTANGVKLTSASANYAYGGGIATWTWFTPLGLVSGFQYQMTFVGSTWLATLNAGTFTTSAPGIGTIIFNGFQLSSNTGSVNSSVATTGFQLSSGTGSVFTAGQSSINYESGDIVVSLNAPLPNGDVIYCQYTQAAPYRVQWPAIGDPTNWPIPLTANAIAFQSGFEDLQVDLGPVKFIAGFPLYGVVFQEFGITRANYVGGNVVFSFAVTSRNRGLVSRGAACVVGGLVYFLAQDGFFVTDGNVVNPIGTDAQNDAGIDSWFEANVNMAALEAIRTGYDSLTRNITFAVPTGVNTLPDTLLSYNPIASKWTKSAIPVELVWTDTNASTTPGTELRLSLFTQAHQYSVLGGPTLNGYLETCDLMDVDGNYRYTFGIRPNVASTDTPQAQAGVRNSMQDAVTYTQSYPPDAFSRVVPALCEGLYTRVRVSSSAASAFNGATLEQQTGGPT